MALTAATPGSRSSLLGEPGPARIAVIWLIIVTAVLRLIGAGVLDLIVGEAYYLSSARGLHFSYFDQPPMSIWLIWATKTLFHSEAPIVLRLPFVLFYAAATWLLYRIGARYRSEWAGFFGALVMNISVLFLLSIGSWLQPEAPLMLFWLATCWGLIGIFFDENPDRPLRRWAWVGIWLGLTFLTKYHAVFLVFSAGVFALTYAPARKWIVHPGPYLAVVVAALVSLPVLVWNLQSHWASFSFQGSRAFGDGFHLAWLLRMIVGQLLYIAPWVALPALAAGVLAALRGPNGVFPQDTPRGFAWFLFWVAVTPIVFFTAVAAGTDTQFHFHWQAPGYMMLFILLGGWIDAALARHRMLISVWLTVSALLTFSILAVLVSHTATGWLRPVFHLGADVEDPTSGAIKWRELGDWYEQSGVLTAPRTFIAGLHWTDCGQIDTPLQGRLPLACLSPDPRNIAFNIDLAKIDGWTGYIIAPYVDLEEVRKRVGAYFDSLELVTTINITRSGFPEFRDVVIIKGTGFRMTRDINTGGKASVTVQRLPRTHIGALSGEVTLPPAAGETTIAVDGKPVGAMTPDPSGTTPFSLTFQSGPWTVGMSDAEISLVPASKPAPGSYGFKTLTVRLE